MAFDFIKQRMQDKKWQKEYDALAPKAGDMAPDFELSTSSGDKTIRVELRSEVLTAILEKPDDDEEKTKWLMEQIIGKTDNELFTITAHAHSLSRTCT